MSGVFSHGVIRHGLSFCEKQENTVFLCFILFMIMTNQSASSVLSIWCRFFSIVNFIAVNILFRYVDLCFRCYSSARFIALAHKSVQYIHFSVKLFTFFPAPISRLYDIPDVKL